MIRRSIRIALPAESVFQGIGHPSQIADWDPSVTSIECPDGMAPGDFGSIEFKHSPKVPFQLIKWSVHTGLALRVDTGLGRVKLNVMWKERDDATQLTYQVHLEGVFAAQLDDWFERCSDKALENLHLRALRVIEGQATSV